MSVIDSCDTLENWTFQYCQGSIESVGMYEGSGYLKLVPDPAQWNGYALLNKGYNHVWDFSQGKLKILLKSSDPSKPISLIFIGGTDGHDDWAKSAAYPLPAIGQGWTLVEIDPKAPSSVSGDFDPSQVGIIQVVVQNQYGAVEVGVDAIILEGGPPPPPPPPPPPGLETLIDTTFPGILDPYTSEYNAGTLSFFSGGVSFSNGRICGRFSSPKKLGYLRATVVVALGSTSGINPIMRLTNSQMGPGDNLFILDVYNGYWRTIYNENGSDVMGDYPWGVPVAAMTQYELTVELKMGYGDGYARLFINGTKVWERLNIYNAVKALSVDVQRIGLYWSSPNTIYFYRSILQGVELKSYSLAGIVYDDGGTPLHNAIVAVGLGEIDPSKPGGGVIHQPIATALTDMNGTYLFPALAQGSYVVEAFRGPGRRGSWAHDNQGYVLDYAEKMKQPVNLDGNLSLNFALRQTYAPPPPVIVSETGWDERSVWVFPYAWGGYPSGIIDTCLDDLRAQMPNINTIDIRLSLNQTSDPNMPIIGTSGHPVTFADIERAANAAHARGLRVHLSIVNYGDGISSNLDPALWFPNYASLFLNPTAAQIAAGQGEGIIPFAMRLRIEELTLGWEFWSARKELEEGDWAGYWGSLVDQIRAAGYTGKLTYHFQTINDPNGYWGPPINKFLQLQGPLISKLDFVVVSDFHIMTFPPNNLDGDEQEAIRTWTQHPDFPPGYGAIPIYRQIYNTFGKKIVVNFGFRLRWGCPVTYGVPDLPKDEHAQSLLYRASLEALSSQPWCGGINVEHFDSDYGPDNPTSCLRDEYGAAVIDGGLASITSTPPAPKPSQASWTPLAIGTGLILILP
jgi:hypothetical protein